jgi:hypothetical protein
MMEPRNEVIGEVPKIGWKSQIMLSPEELLVIDDFRFQHRMPTRAAAIRELLKLGLAANGTSAGAGMKSSNYGVFSRGPTGHRDSDTNGE